MDTAVFDDVIQQGGYWSIGVTLTDDSVVPSVPVNFTGYTIKSQMVYMGQGTWPRIDITAAIDADPTTGKFTLAVVGPTPPGVLLLYAYDVVLTKAGHPESTLIPIKGTLTVEKTITVVT